MAKLTAVLVRVQSRAPLTNNAKNGVIFVFTNKIGPSVEGPKYRGSDYSLGVIIVFAAVSAAATSPVTSATTAAATALAVVILLRLTVRLIFV